MSSRKPDRGELGIGVGDWEAACHELCTAGTVAAILRRTAEIAIARNREAWRGEQQRRESQRYGAGTKL